MSRFLLLLFLLPIFAGCGGPNDNDKLSPEVLNAEKQEVINTLKEYNTAFEEKNFSRLVPTLSEDVVFFGTDSAEVIKSLSEFKNVLEKQWNTYDTMIYGNMSDVVVQMDNKASVASVYYGIPCTIVNKDGKHENMFLRVARTLKKEKNKWTIVSGIVSIARTGNASIETLNIPADTTAKTNK
jgi:ketosteroid isomerase-like protein